jgi:hypothetical protein
MSRAGKLPPLEQVSEAVLICNGLSADGYEAPAGVYAMCLNGGFTRHRADAALTVDCPGVIREAWARFRGDKVVSAHMPEFPSGERYECLELVRRFSSATPAALAWLHQRKGAKKVTIVGLDSLWGAGASGAQYNLAVAMMVDEMAQYFPDGLFIRRGEEVIRVGAGEFGAQVAAWKSAAPAVPAQQVAPRRDRRGRPVEREYPACRIPHTLVEVDVSPRCTRECAFCAPGIPKARRRQKRGLSLAAFRAVVDELAGLGFGRPDRCLCICGHGEPLLNPALPDMLRAARAALPEVELAVYTNCDLLTAEFVSLVEALDARLIADVYDAATAERLPHLVAASGATPGRVLVVDHLAGDWRYTSRCQTVDPSAAPETGPCGMPGGKLFVTDDGKGGAASLLCCEDYGRQTLESRALRLDSAPIAERAGVCARCNRRDGGGWTGWGAYRPLMASRFWPPSVSAPSPAPRRLVVLPVCAKWADHARALLGAIERLSVCPGETMILWNGSEPCPADLAGPGRIVREYPDLGGHPDWPGAPLAWTAIGRWIGEALEWARSELYDWVIKLDTDTAILRRGWDAAVIGPAVQGEVAGFMLEEKVCEWATAPLDGKAGIFVPQIRRLLDAGHMRWARGHLDSAWQKNHHLQGGCYAVSRGAIDRLERSGVGIVPSEAEQTIGEDVLFSLRCRVAGIPQRHTQAVCSHYFPRGSYHPTVARYYRDCGGAAVIHPVKELDALRRLALEAADGCA